jgi:cobalt-zinc-cadmium efflux system protein
MHVHSHAEHRAHDQAAQFNRVFATGIALNVAFVVVEAGAGFWADSLALLADAGHNLSDVLGLALAWGAAVLARRRPSARFTYGLRGSSIWAAVANAVLLLVACGALAFEAVDRFGKSAAVPGTVLMIVAGVGVLVNTASALLFMKGSREDLNLRGAFLHMAADAAVSLGVVLAGLGIVLTGWTWLDPAITLVIIAVIVASTWGMLRQSADLALSAVPAGIDPAEVRNFLGELEGVTEVHELHIWAMSTREVALTAHLIMCEGHPGDAFFSKAAQGLHLRFGIEHPTLQIEIGDEAAPCKLAPDHVV